MTFVKYIRKIICNFPNVQQEIFHAIQTKLPNTKNKFWQRLANTSRSQFMLTPLQVLPSTNGFKKQYKTEKIQQEWKRLKKLEKWGN